MKLKRFVAADMRSALAKIKEELGAEAVIMSNKRVANGVEIIAGVETKTVSVEELSTTADNDSITSKVLKEDSPLSRIIKDDEVTLTSSKNAAKAQASKEISANKNIVGGSKAEGFARSLLEILERQKQEQNKAQEAKKVVNTSYTNKVPPAPLSEQSGLKDLFVKEKDRDLAKKVETTHGISSYESKESLNEKNELSKMRQEVDSIRRLLQFELAGLMSDSKKREEPVRAMIYELLLSSGFEKHLSQELSENIDADASFNFAWRQLASIVEKRLTVDRMKLSMKAE